MNLIKVSSGHYVDIINPDPNTLDIYTISSALSKICRFGGHCPKYYSVAEHCIHSTQIGISEGYDNNALKTIFMHDASEAYIGDIVRPLKANLSQYRKIEERINRAIEYAFNIKFDKFKNEIKNIDNILLKAEKRTMWPEDKNDWGLENYKDYLFIKFKFWTPKQSEKKFLEIAKALELY